jgi:sugar phosphate isomerase/epimerase
MRRGVHEHLFFGEGEMNMPAILQALKEIDFRKLVSVELSRHSHCADRIIPAAIEFLRRTERDLNSQFKESAA